MPDQNPAARLLHWLRLGHEQSAQETVYATFMRLWDIDFPTHEEDQAEFLRCAGLMGHLTAETRRRAEALPDSLAPDVLLRHFIEVENTVANFINSPKTMTISTFFGPLDDTGWHSLELLERFLSLHGEPSNMDYDQLASLVEDVRQLIDAISGDDHLDADLQRYLVARMHEVERALLDARIVGPSEVVLVTNSLYGAVRREADLWERIEKTRWAPRIASVYVGLCMTVQAGAGVLALMPGVEPTEPTQTEIQPSEPGDGIVVVPIGDEADA